MWYEGKSYTYSQTVERVNNLAASLVEDAGIRPGDRVGIWGPNCVEYVEAILSVNMIGAIPELYNSRWSDAVVSNLLKEGAVRFAFIGNGPLCASLVEQHPEVRFIVMGGTIEGAEPYDSFIAKGEGKTVEPVELDPSDVALHMFTSGTTGTPKCVMATCESLIMQTLISSASEKWTEDDVCLCCFPFFHVSGFSIYKAFYNAATLVISRSTHLDEIARLIQECHVTRTALVPVLLKGLLDMKEQTDLDLSSLKLITYGSTHVSPELLARCGEVIGCGFYQAYGMTESVGPITALTPEDHKDISLLETAGKPLVGVDIRIVDDHGTILPPNTCGEVVIRSYTTMKGYRNRATLMDEVLYEGWYRTHDMGHIDERGYLHIEGRKDGMIITGGENVFPQEISDCISHLEGVAEVAVVGVKDEHWGQCPAAFVVKKPDAHITKEEVTSFCAARLARYKKPKWVHFVDELPRGGMGKVSDVDLRKLHEEFTGNKA